MPRQAGLGSGCRQRRPPPREAQPGWPVARAPIARNATVGHRCAACFAAGRCARPASCSPPRWSRLARRRDPVSLRKLADEVRLQRKARKLGARIRAAGDARPILVILEGPDRIVKIYLDAGGDRLAQTIGKREALAPDKLAESDYRTFRDRKLIRALFASARERTGGAIRWHVVPMDDRGEGRFELLDVLRRALL